MPEAVHMADQSDSETDKSDYYDELEDADMDPKTFHTGATLQPPKAYLYTTEQLHTWIHEAKINLNPPYQRDVIWADKKQSKLIESIYQNYYIPPILFAIYKDEDGEEQKVCIDGKQRLTSIQKFFDGQIAFKDPITKKSWWYTRPNSQSLKRQEVPDFWKRDFKTKQITCVEYRDPPKSLERDLFKRVQEGVPLTTAEKMQALASHCAYWVQELDKQFLGSEDGLPGLIDLNIKRGANFQLLAQLVFCCHGYESHVFPHPTKTEQFVTSSEPLQDSFKREVYGALRELWHIASEDSLNMPFQSIKQRVAPAEFVFIGVLLYLTPKQTHQFRASEVLALRKHIRGRYTDIRMRPDVVKDLWAYIDNLMARIQGRPTKALPTAPVPAPSRNKRKKAGIDEEYTGNGVAGKKTRK